MQQRKALLKRLEGCGLSPREMDVALLALRGYSNGEIAKKLCRSEPTIKDHLQHIFTKVGVDNRIKFISKIVGLEGEMGVGKR